MYTPYPENRVASDPNHPWYRPDYAEVVVVLDGAPVDAERTVVKAVAGDRGYIQILLKDANGALKTKRLSNGKVKVITHIVKGDVRLFRR